MCGACGTQKENRIKRRKGHRAGGRAALELRSPLLLSSCVAFCKDMPVSRLLSIITYACGKLFRVSAAGTATSSAADQQAFVCLSQWQCHRLHLPTHPLPRAGAAFFLPAWFSLDRGRCIGCHCPRHVPCWCVCEGVNSLSWCHFSLPLFWEEANTGGQAPCSERLCCQAPCPSQLCLVSSSPFVHYVSGREQRGRRAFLVPRTARL